VMRAMLYNRGYGSVNIATSKSAHDRVHESADRESRADA
jgi:hypothetical protein